MDSEKFQLKHFILCNNEIKIAELLENGFDTNFENGWPIRLAARHGLYSIVKLFIQYGANPHLLSEAGASTLQLAVFSGLHWETDAWADLLSCCDSSQLADGAAVAIIFNNIVAFNKIFLTGRCNIHIPTSLTGKTVENLAKCYKLQYLLNIQSTQNILQVTPHSSPRELRRGCSGEHSHPRRNLSPSVARFFDLTAHQPSLFLPQSPNAIIVPSPTRNFL